MVYDAIIVGKGPAGIQAGLYLSRANMKVLIIAKDEGALAKTDRVENYYGIKSIKAQDLIQVSYEQMKKFSMDYQQEELLDIKAQDSCFTVHTDQGDYRSLSVLLAMGFERRRPGIRNLRKFEGKGVSYCAICDGFFFKDQKIGLLGQGPFADYEYEILKSYSQKIIRLTNGEKIKEASSEVYEEKILELQGDNYLESLIFRDGRSLKLDGLFLAMDSASANDLALKIGLEHDKQKILVDESMQTNIPGIFAAGDCTFGPQQISKAVGDGAVAGIAMTNYIRRRKRGQ